MAKAASVCLKEEAKDELEEAENTRVVICEELFWDYEQKQKGGKLATSAGSKTGDGLVQLHISR